MADNSIDDTALNDLPVEPEPTPEPNKKPAKQKGKRILGRSLFVILIIVLILVGFVLVQQAILDLEAQAQISAAQTAAAPVLIVSETFTPIPLESTKTSTLESTSTPMLPTAIYTPDVDQMHTATISALLTESAP